MERYVPEFYIRSFIGKEIPSREFADAFYAWRQKLVDDGLLDHNTELGYAYGRPEELKAARFDLGDIEPAYHTESIFIITEMDSGKVMNIMRSITVSYRRNVNEEGAIIDETVERTFLLPRYPALKGEWPFTSDLFYYLGITLDRFEHQYRLFFPKNFKKIEPVESAETNKVLDKLLRPRIEGIHGYNCGLKDEPFYGYLTITREMAKIILLRSAPLYEKENRPHDVVARAFRPISEGDIPEIFSDPNQLLELALRMSVIAVHAAIYDNQRITKGDMGMFRDELNQCRKEMEYIYGAIMSSSYNAGKAHEKSFPGMKNEEARAYEKMYKEVFGDLGKTVSMVFKGTETKTPLSMDELMAKRKEAISQQLFHNRTYKIGECFIEIAEIKRFIKFLRVPDERVEELVGNLINHAVIYAGTSSSDEKYGTDALWDYKSSAAQLEKYIGRLEDTDSKDNRHAAGTLRILKENLNDLAMSKRANNISTKRIIDAIMRREQPAKDFDGAGLS